MAVSLLRQAYYTIPHEDAIPIYQAIVAQYPQSQFEIDARLAMLNIRFGYSDMEGWLKAADGLAQSFGGPSVADIVRGNRRAQLSARVLALPKEYQIGLLDVYGQVHGGLGFLDRYDQAAQVALFNKDTFS